jgi:casein kinase 1
LTYARKLGFEETPDYDYLRGLMNKVLANLNETDDGVFDWMLLPEKETSRKHKSLNAEDKNKFDTVNKSMAPNISNMPIASSSGDAPLNNAKRSDSRLDPDAVKEKKQTKLSATANRSTSEQQNNQKITSKLEIEKNENRNESRQQRREENGFKAWFLKTFCCNSSAN